MKLLGLAVFALLWARSEKGARLLASKSLLNRYYNIYNVGSRLASPVPLENTIPPRPRRTEESQMQPAPRTQEPHLELQCTQSSSNQPSKSSDWATGSVLAGVGFV
uniref:Uncharacterized protein n=1 Tax=Gopherus evgoodei TaxID=1825980 RepID=A0A8C4W226_9SAUR